MNSSRTADTARNGLKKYAKKQSRLLDEICKSESANATPAQSVRPDPIYFQLFYRESARRRADLEMTHEPGEIESQMALYIPMIYLHVRMDICAFGAIEKI